MSKEHLDFKALFRLKPVLLTARVLQSAECTSSAKSWKGALANLASRPSVNAYTDKCSVNFSIDLIGICAALVASSLHNILEKRCR